MRDHYPLIAFIAFVLALLIGFAVTQRAKPDQRTREQLRRELEAAERRHGPRKHIRKLYQQATTDQIKRECA